MALDQNAQYPVGTIGPNANYPEGEAVNSSAPGALDGYPWEKEGVNDLLGWQQALLRVGGVAANGNPDTAVQSQYLQMIVELAQGRAVNYDDSGIADAYVLDVQANQQAPANLFDGQVFEFIPANTGTGAATANPAGLGALSIKILGGVSDPAAGQIFAGKPATLVYRTLPGAHLELKGAPFISAGQTITAAGLLTIAHGLGVKPRGITGYVKCTTADAGYAIGDEVEVSLGIFTVDTSGATVGYNASVWLDGVNINVRYGSSTGTFSFGNKSTGVRTGFTNTSWQFYLRAFA